MSDQKCRQRWASHKDSRMRDLSRLWKAYQAGEDSAYYKRVYTDLGDLNEYGLALDYVAPNTFRDQKRGFWRYQISWGGPAEEFRFYGELTSEYEAALDHIEFWFLDWGDGYGRKLVGRDLAVMSDMFSMWAECGTLSHLRNEALEGR